MSQNLILKNLKLVERAAQVEQGKTLLDAYGSIFGHVGNAGDLAILQNEHDVAYYKTEYNSFTLGNQMKPDYILRKNGEYAKKKIVFILKHLIII